MQRHLGRHRDSLPLRGGPGPRSVRLGALTGVVAFIVALPLTVASAGPVGDEGPAVVGASGRVDEKGRPPGSGGLRASSSRLLGRDLATAARCGPALSSPDGIEAQTCVLTRGADTWARTYYRNATGDALSSVLSLMGPAGHSVQMRCVVDAEDDPGACETPRERTAGGAGAYTAVAEFAKGAGDGPLLLRSGSSTGS
ncbi:MULTISPECIES: hypothetical protein [unclassified Streptomyces]|uniref:hypothetical protein n=1 Tax=unclassified Streptomyces TaxID=2593676 RepID=UPI00380DE045|nr:hypothetical protein OG199_21995 [Streptomyces sp. NBC_01176]